MKRSKKIHKDAARLMTLRGGPFDAQKVRLSGDALRVTVEFTAKGMTGRYENGYWKQSTVN